MKGQKNRSLAFVSFVLKTHHTGYMSRRQCSCDQNIALRGVGSIPQKGTSLAEIRCHSPGL